MWPFRRSPLVVELTRLLKFCDEWEVYMQEYLIHKPTKTSIRFGRGKKRLKISVGARPDRFDYQIEPTQAEKRTLFRAAKRAM